MIWWVATLVGGLVDVLAICRVWCIVMFPGSGLPGVDFLCVDVMQILTVLGYCGWFLVDGFAL